MRPRPIAAIVSLQPHLATRRPRSEAEKAAEVQLPAVDNNRRTCASVSTLAAAVYILIGKSTLDLAIGPKSQTNATPIQARPIAPQMALTLPSFAAVASRFALTEELFLISDAASDKAAILAIVRNISAAL